MATQKVGQSGSQTVKRSDRQTAKPESKKPQARNQGYCLVVASDVIDLMGRVEALMAEGWELHGAPLMEGFDASRWQYAQALVRSGKEAADGVK